MIDKSLRVLNVKYMDEYKLKVKFSDGNTKLIDLKEYLEKNKNTVFEPLLDKTLFKEAYVDFTVCWPNEIDIAPEVLYELGSSLEKKRINPKILALTGLIKNEEVFDMELDEEMERREWTSRENPKEIIDVIDKATGDKITTIEISKEDLKRMEQREGKKYKEVLGILIHKFATGKIKI